MTTEHISFVRGQTFTKTRVSRDDNNRPRDLTGAKIYIVMKPNIKATDPSVKITSDGSPPMGWRTGVVINDQTQTPGSYTYTFVPADTSSLIALGHDDPWIYDIRIVMADTSVVQDIDNSNVDLYPQVGDVP